MNDPQSNAASRAENERDAYFLATRANHQHGRRRTNAEKQTVVLRWIEDEEMCQWTDGYIAKMCHVNPNTVANIRDRTQDIPSQPTKRKFINGKGEVEWMHTGRIGKTQTSPTIGKPNVNFKEVEDAIVEKASDTEPIPPSPNLQSFDDEYPNISTEDLIEKQEKLRGEVFKFAIETNGLPPGNLLIDWNRLLSHAEKQHKGIIRDELVDPDRDKLINQIKIWSHFAYQAEVASDILVAMLANFDYEMDKRDGKRFPDLEECNWIVDLGLPNVLKEIISRTQNRYSNSQSDLGLASLPFYDDPGFYSYAEKQYPRYLVKSHPALDTAEDRESNLGAIKTWHALGEDIRNRADWIQDIKREIDDDLAKEAAAEEGPDLQGLREEIDDLLGQGESIDEDELSKKYNVSIKQVVMESHLVKQEKETVAPPDPDRKGLRKNLEAMVGSDTEPNPSILTKLYHVPEAEIHAEIEEVFGEEEASTELQIQPVTDPEPEKILLEDNTYTKEHLLNCKRTISELIELEDVPLIIKFAAEHFLETIEKSLLTNKEVS